MDPAAFSEEYTVRRIEESDIPAVLEFCRQNPLYYRYCPPAPSAEGIREDMRVLPPKKTAEDKYYVGFFREGILSAVMDFIDRYPNDQTAFLGFFMVKRSLQGQGVGTGMIQSLCRYLSDCGYRFVRLGWVQGNRQSEHFWHKNQFEEIGVVSRNTDYTIIYAQRTLQKGGDNSETMD